jgi:hypothetical protein
MVRLVAEAWNASHQSCARFLDAEYTGVEPDFVRVMLSILTMHHQLVEVGYCWYRHGIKWQVFQLHGWNGEGFQSMGQNVSIRIHSR